MPASFGAAAARSAAALIGFIDVDLIPKLLLVFPVFNVSCRRRPAVTGKLTRPFSTDTRNQPSLQDSGTRNQEA